MLMMLTSAAKITSRCRYTAIHLSGYRSSADIFLAPLERIDFLTYLHANDGCGPDPFRPFVPALCKFRRKFAGLVWIHFEVTRTAGLKTSAAWRSQFDKLCCRLTLHFCYLQRLPRGRRGRLLAGRAKAGRVSRPTKSL